MPSACSSPVIIDQPTAHGLKLLSMISSPPRHLTGHSVRKSARAPWPALLLFLCYASFTPSPIHAWTLIPMERRTFPTRTLTRGTPNSCRPRARSLCTSLPRSTFSLAVSSFLDHEVTERTSSSPLSMSIDDLSSVLGGKGRAQSCWECFRLGVDPLWLYNIDEGNNSNNNNNNNGNNGNNGNPVETEPNVQSLTDGIIHTANTIGWTREEIHRVMAATPGHRPNQMLGRYAQDKLQEYFGTGGRNNNNPDQESEQDHDSSSASSPPPFSIETHVAQLSKINVASDGTSILLLNLVQDGLQVETVIIPWQKSTSSRTGIDDQTVTVTPRRRSTSTLCVSSQVGCAQACRFCMTGRMGKLRSLTADEILSQVYWANKACRLIPSLQSHPIENVVFMGMGEPADNAAAVVQAAQVMTNPTAGFQLAPRHVTISTVAPTPESFAALLVESSSVQGINKVSSFAPSAVLAWSVHSSKDEIRQQLVPTTQYSMVELRNGLRDALLSRTSKRLRTCMLEMTLLDGINDTPDDAHHLAQAICQPLLQDVPGLKLVVNLIPWNDIGATFGPASLYRTPPLQHVRDYQSVLQTYEGISCFVRTTRGDDESAACGMLATSSKKKTTATTTTTTTKNE